MMGYPVAVMICILLFIAGCATSYEGGDTTEADKADSTTETADTGDVDIATTGVDKADITTDTGDVDIATTDADKADITTDTPTKHIPTKYRPAKYIPTKYTPAIDATKTPAQLAHECELLCGVDADAYCEGELVVEVDGVEITGTCRAFSKHRSDLGFERCKGFCQYRELSGTMCSVGGVKDKNCDGV